MWSTSTGVLVGRTKGVNTMKHLQPKLQDSSEAVTLNWLLSTEWFYKEQQYVQPQHHGELLSSASKHLPTDP